MDLHAKSVLVIGGGVAGMTAALEAAEVGCNVTLVEKEAYLGGRVIRTHRYFPKMCPPSCGFEINTRRIRNNPRITVHTMATVEEIAGHAGNFRANVRIRPRYVTGAVSLDDSLSEKLASERDNDFNIGMDRTKALYMPHEMSFPHLHVVDRQAMSDADVAVLEESSPPGSIDMAMQEKLLEINAGAIIIATGWKPYDPDALTELGFGRCSDVITNVMMERLAAPDGPTGGRIIRPSDGGKPGNIAFVQCAGSRDENHLPYCSAVCCMASLKQARYVREWDEEACVTVFYIDIRTIGSLEKFYYDLLEDDKISFVKGKVARINESPDGAGLILDVEDTLSGHRIHPGFDMVVLATGIIPNGIGDTVSIGFKLDAYGFMDSSSLPEGIFASGCAKRPCDVSRTTKDSTAAALKAIQCFTPGE